MGLTKSRFRAQLTTGIIENDSKLLRATVDEMKAGEYDINITMNPEGHTIYTLAIEGIHSGKVTLDTFKLLIKLGFDVNKQMESALAFTPLYAAVRRNQLGVVRLLLDSGADATLGESTSEDPLFTACGMGFVDCVEVLLKAGANPDSVSPGPGGTPMMLTVQTSHVNAPRILQLLIEHGANLKFVNRVKRNGLHAAADCLADVTDSAQILLDAGVDVNKQDMYGQTPMHMAAVANRPRVIKLFLDRGADPNIKSKEGETPLDIAYRMEHPDTIAVLKHVTGVGKYQHTPTSPEPVSAETSVSPQNPEDPGEPGVQTTATDAAPQNPADDDVNLLTF